MRYSEQNDWGVQSIEEPDVRNSTAIVGNTAAAVGKGASLGSSILPGWGTAIGAVVGGATGFLGAKMGQDKEQNRLDEAEKYNMLVDNMTKRSRSDGTTMMMVAEDGAVADGTEAVEFEDTEIHGRYTKTKDGGSFFQIKNIAPPGKTHPAETGSDPDLLIPTGKGKSKGLSYRTQSKTPIQDGDIILNNQGSLSEALSLIKKVNDQNPHAIKKMEKWIRTLPSSESTAEQGARYKKNKIKRQSRYGS